MKKIRPILRLALVPGVIFISSCSALFYAPTSQTPHMLEEQGDLAVSGTLQITPYSGSIAGDLAFALDSMFFITGNYQYFEYSPDIRASFFEFGMGYYSKVGKYGFFESSLLYGQTRGLYELNPGQIMYFSMHAPSVSGILGVKGKYLFASLGIKVGLLDKIETSYINTSADWRNPWYNGDHGVYALEYMRYAAFSQFTATIGVKYNAVSLSYFNAILAGPKAYGTRYRFQAEQFAAGLRLQVNLNILGSGKKQ